jgi:hypothetical protein
MLKSWRSTNTSHGIPRLHGFRGEGDCLKKEGRPKSGQVHSPSSGMLLSLAIFVGSFDLVHLTLREKVLLRVRLPHAARNVLYFVEGFFRRAFGSIDLRGSLGVLVECSVGKFASRAFDVDLRDAVGVGRAGLVKLGRALSGFSA